MVKKSSGNGMRKYLIARTTMVNSAHQSLDQTIAKHGTQGPVTLNIHRAIIMR